MINILKGSLAHDGLAVIDVISPCVTFNNHEGSTKGYTYSKEHDELLHQIGFVQSYEQIDIDYAPDVPSLVGRFTPVPVDLADGRPVLITDSPVAGYEDRLRIVPGERPLLVRPSLPRFLTVGDKLTLQAVVQVWMAGSQAWR